MCLRKAASEIVRRTQRGNGGRSEKVREEESNKIHSKGSTGEGKGQAPRDAAADVGIYLGVRRAGELASQK